MISLHCASPLFNMDKIRYFHTEALHPHLPFLHKLCRRRNQSFAFLSYHQSILKFPAPWKEARQTDEYHSIIRINKRSMGYIAHLRNSSNQLTQSTNNNAPIMSEHKKKIIISFLRIERLIIYKTWIPFSHGYNAPLLVEIGLVVL